MKDEDFHYSMNKSFGTIIGSFLGAGLMGITKWWIYPDIYALYEESQWASHLFWIVNILGFIGFAGIFRFLVPLAVTKGKYFADALKQLGYWLSMSGTGFFILGVLYFRRSDFFIGLATIMIIPGFLLFWIQDKKDKEKKARDPGGFEDDDE